jgi:hypothetical protein
MAFIVEVIMILLQLPVEVGPAVPLVVERERLVCGCCY